MKTVDDRLAQFSKWHKSSKDQHKDWRNEAKRNYDFYAGRQLTKDEEAVYEEEMRQPVTFNRIGPLIDAVSGHQINNRQEARFLPRQIGDVQVSEVLTGASQWVDDEAAQEDEDDEIFQDLCITGMGWSEARLSYDDNLDGQIIPGERFSPLEAYWDPNAKRRNLADSKWRMRGRWMSRSDAEAKWPKLKDVDLANSEYQWEEESSQDEPHNAARAHFYENDARQWYNEHKDEVFILHVQWWEFKPVYRVGEGNRILEFSESKFSKIKEAVEERGIKYVRQMKKEYFKSFVAGPYELEYGPNGCPHFTLMCVTGKRDAQKNDWFGLVRPLIDPQKWSNKFLSDLQEMVVSTRQGGAIVESSALVDPRRAEEGWNKYGIIQVNDGALQRGAIKETIPPPLPPALDRMIEWCISAIPSVSGINQEFMGYADRDQPNVLELQRKRSALTVLAPMFASLRKYRKDRAEVVLYFIRTYLNDGRLIRILGGDGTEQYIPLAIDPQVEDYDIIIDESSSSPNQKEEAFSVILALLPHMITAGILPPPEILDYLPLPSSFTSKWKEMLQPKPPSEQEQIAKETAIADIEEKRAQVREREAKARREMAEAFAQELQNYAVKEGFMLAEDL